MMTPEELDHIYLESFPPALGPGALLERFQDPDRGTSTTRDLVFTRLLLTRTRLVPVVTEFFRRSHEFCAMRDLQQAASQLADSMRTDPMASRAVLLKAVADRYLATTTIV